MSPGHGHGCADERLGNNEARAAKSSIRIVRRISPAPDAVQVSVDSTLDHYVAGLQVGADTSVSPDSKTAVEQFDTASQMPAFSSSGKFLLSKAVFS